MDLEGETEVKGKVGVLTAVVTLGTALGWVSPALAQRADRNIDPPIVRAFNWFGYVAADDIRSQCTPGGRDRLRLIYNALWEEQVRTYEIFLQPDGYAGLNVGVLADQGKGADVSNLIIGQARDATEPWRTKRAQRLLNPGETTELLGLLQASNAFGPPRDGMKLPDNDFWWTVASCRNGQWGFQAYHFPTDGFANVKFADRLFSWDAVPVAVSKPRKLLPAELRRDEFGVSEKRALGRGDRWMLVVGKDGLRPR